LDLIIIITIFFLTWVEISRRIKVKQLSKFDANKAGLESCATVQFVQFVDSNSYDSTSNKITYNNILDMQQTIIHDPSFIF